MGNETFQWLGLLMPAFSGLMGVAVGYGMLLGHVKSLLKWKDMVSVGGEKGQPIYMLRTECVDFRENCLDTRCAEITKMQNVLAEHAGDIRAFRNFAFWFLSNKEGLPLAEVNEILTFPHRRMGDWSKG